MAEIANSTRVNLLVVKHVRTDLEKGREMQNTSEAIFQWIKLNQRKKQVYWNININDKMRTTFSKIRMCPLSSSVVSIKSTP